MRWLMVLLYVVRFFLFFRPSFFQGWPDPGIVLYGIRCVCVLTCPPAREGCFQNTKTILQATFPSPEN